MAFKVIAILILRLLNDVILELIRMLLASMIGVDKDGRK